MPELRLNVVQYTMVLDLRDLVLHFVLNRPTERALLTITVDC